MIAVFGTPIPEEDDIEFTVSSPSQISASLLIDTA